jgi:predicted RND superfamily exporter protein
MFKIPSRNAAGTSYERAANGLTEMGPAILNGGITTFLALVFLSLSDSYAYLVFFKIFFLSVIFGLFHGLCFLPVILSVMGEDKRASLLVQRATSTLDDLDGVSAGNAMKTLQP